MDAVNHNASRRPDKAVFHLVVGAFGRIFAPRPVLQLPVPFLEGFIPGYIVAERDLKPDAGSLMQSLRVRAVKPDFHRARAIIKLLRTEGIRADFGSESTSFGESREPRIYICSQASLRTRSFAAELERDILRPWTIIAVFERVSNFSLGKVIDQLAQADLINWDRRDRIFAGVRDLVLACQRALGQIHGSKPLSIAQLRQRRAQARGSSTIRLRSPAETRNEFGHDDAPLSETEEKAAFQVELGDFGSFHQTDDMGFRDQANWVPQTDDLRPLSAPAVARLRPHASPGRTGDRPELVDASVFAPESAQAGGHLLVQVFLHALDDISVAESEALNADRAAKRRVITTLTAHIYRGQRVDIAVEAAALKVDHPVQHLIWHGVPRACQFLLKMPSRASATHYYIRVRLAVQSIPVGILSFSVSAATNADPPMLNICGQRRKQFRYAFLSYASSDRADVLKAAQTLNALRIGFFHDILSIEPGAEWTPRLFKEIDRCDLFLLFWSSRAARSRWVIREVKHALNRQKSSRDKSPDITPIILEGPPIPRPPQLLKHLHFNDALRLVTAAVENAKKARAGKRSVPRRKSHGRRT
jgi:hypothetical protein